MRDLKAIDQKESSDPDGNHEDRGRVASALGLRWLDCNEGFPKKKACHQSIETRSVTGHENDAAVVAKLFFFRVFEVRFFSFVGSVEIKNRFF